MPRLQPWETNGVNGTANRSIVHLLYIAIPMQVNGQLWPHRMAGMVSLCRYRSGGRDPRRQSRRMALGRGVVCHSLVCHYLPRLTVSRITPSLFNGYADEWSLCDGLGKSKCLSRLSDHWE